MFGAAATSPSMIHHRLTGEDCESTLRCMTQMGLRSEPIGESAIRLIPAQAWNSPSADLDCGNSGTTMRLLSGMIAGRPITATLTGDASLSRRPMGRIAEPLRLMGAMVEGITAPLKITGGNLTGIDYKTPVASAQIKSAILLAGLLAEGDTTVEEPELSRDHTERMLRSLGVPVRTSGTRITVSAATWDGFEISIPADVSSAAFLAVLAVTSVDAEITLHEVGSNPSRSGLFDVLDAAGVAVTWSNHSEQMGEPTVSMTLRGANTLDGFKIEGSLVPRLIDEIPVLAVLATQCNGQTIIRDAKEMRVKESDRIACMVEGLRAMGAKIEATDDGMIIEGPTPLAGTHIDASGDHRIAMSFAIAGLIASHGDTIIDGADSIATSYPNFLSDLATIGAIMSP